MRVIAEWLQKLDPQSDGAARDWVAIYDECSRILYQEIDYRLEGANADRFRCCYTPDPSKEPVDSYSPTMEAAGFGGGPQFFCHKPAHPAVVRSNRAIDQHGAAFGLHGPCSCTLHSLLGPAALPTV